MKLIDRETNEEIPISRLFKPEDIILDTEDELVVKDGEMIRVFHDMNGKPHSMWYPSVEVYEQYKKEAKEAYDKFWNKIMWGK